MRKQPRVKTVEKIGQQQVLELLGPEEQTGDCRERPSRRAGADEKIEDRSQEDGEAQGAFQEEAMGDREMQQM